MVNDPIADLISRMNNASRAGHLSFNVPASRLKESVLKVLLEGGYIHRYELLKDAESKPFIKVQLRYTQNGKPAIREIARLSSPGRRIYVGADEIPRLKGGLGTVLVSTSRGVVTDSEARKLGVGGELICSVF